MSLTIALASFLISTIIYSLYRRITRISISKIPGPEPESFLLGNLPELFQGQAGEADFKWQAEYGDVVRIKGFLGDDRLLISDPKALQYIYQTSGYHWHKQIERRELSRIIAGHGLTWADTDDHKRQRKVMLPGFGFPESRAFLPLFFSCADKLSAKWKDMLSSSPEGSLWVNIPYWTSRATLDAIGEAAFDYRFGATDDEDNALAKSYGDLLTATFGSPSRQSILMISTWGYLPEWIRRLWIRNSAKFRQARHTEKIGNDVAKSLLESKADAHLQGKASRDVMSLLVRSNASENEKMRMSDDELVSQMRTIMLAGHETTSNTIGWALLELSRHPEMQRKLRNEIWDAESNIRTHGRTQFEASDFDAMPYLTAFVKEVLRFHPVSYNNFRQAGRDDVLPLSTPIRTKDGELITKLPVPKGLKIITSIAGYNRNKQVFGEDAHIFNPDRWFRKSDKKETTVGVYANLLTFAAGIRSCIGWRFAVLEIHAFIIELIGNFEFELTSEAQRIRREACLVMVPTVEGQVEKGAQLPLRVRLAVREE